MAKQPELIRIVNSRKRKLEVDYNYNTCDLRIEIENDQNSITLKESEARKLHNALSRFLELREFLLDNFYGNKR